MLRRQGRKQERRPVRRKAGLRTRRRRSPGRCRAWGRWTRLQGARLAGLSVCSRPLLERSSRCRQRPRKETNRRHCANRPSPRATPGNRCSRALRQSICASHRRGQARTVRRTEAARTKPLPALQRSDRPCRAESGRRPVKLKHAWRASRPRRPVALPSPSPLALRQLLLLLVLQNEDPVDVQRRRHPMKLAPTRSHRPEHRRRAFHRECGTMRRNGGKRPSCPPGRTLRSACARSGSEV